jgi:hypothetical protein
MAVLNRLQRAGVHRGILGGSRAWTAIAVASFTLRHAAKLVRKQPKVVYCQELEPGQSILISHTTETWG